MKCRKNLRCPLTVTDISQIFNTWFFKDVLHKSWLIIFTHLIKWVVPKFKVFFWIIKPMTSWMASPSWIVEPHVKTLVCEKESHWVWAIAANARSWITEAVLVKQNWLLLLIIGILSSRSPFWSADSEYCVIVEVFRHVCMFLYRIIILSHHLHQSAILILLFFPCECLTHTLLHYLEVLLSTRLSFFYKTRACRHKTGSFFSRLCSEGLNFLHLCECLTRQ